MPEIVGMLEAEICKAEKDLADRSHAGLKSDYQIGYVAGLRRALVMLKESQGTVPSPPR
jgi:hypothetical protein